MDTGKVVIEKLNGKNFLIWAAQIEALLFARGLWQYLEMEVQLPPPESDKHAQAVRDKNMARATIICSLESEYVAMVAGDKNPKRMWDKLSAAH